MPKSKKSLEEEEDATQPLLEDESQDDEDDRRKRRNMFTLIVTSSFNVLGYGFYITAYSQWIYVRFEMDVMGANFSKLNGSAAHDPCFRGNPVNSEFKSQLNLAQAKAAHFSVLTTLCCLIPSFFVNLVLGAYSDQIGRRLIFLVPLIGGIGRAAIVCAVAHWDLDLNFILVGFTFCGLSGDFIAYVMAIFVYTADNTTKGKNRSFLMVFASAVHFICYNLSQFACGYFIESQGYVWPMITGFAAMVFSFILTTVFLRETLDKSKVKRASLIQGVKGIFSFYLDEPVDPLHKRKDFILLGLVFFVYASSIGSSITTIFMMNEPFCWGSKHIGYVNSAFGLGHAMLSTMVMRLMQKFFSDEILVVFSLLSSAGQRFSFAFANSDRHLYIGYTAGALEISVLAVIRAIMSRMVPKDKRGSLFASMAVIETATLAASGAGLNELYSHTVSQWRGLTFFVIGCITCFSAVLMTIYKIVISTRESSRVKSTTLIINGHDDKHPSMNGVVQIDPRKIEKSA
ncbi:hypothetical protein RRG08_034833 [Elysia crispata]|uniref:Major facilitator superfamily (MFS) profile domain-containing protein n=1 Tax=Elysia crispata TaxID=231223 RepID=A0AAE1AMG3_9GAST|nr:hypothetical protein RRG08_034833 [Elysia crispata]